MPAFKGLERFHGENVVRTVMRSVGPVKNGWLPPSLSHTLVLSSNIWPLRSAGAARGKLLPRLHLAQVCEERKGVVLKLWEETI